MLLHQPKFLGRERAGLFQHAVFDTDFSDVVQQRRNAQLVQLFRAESQLLADQRRILGHATGVTARVRILFVDGRGEHADRSDKQLAILFGGFLQALDVFLDVACHLVEIFSELANLRSPADGRALVKFATADRAGGGCQPADGLADAHGKEIPDENGGQNDHHDERQGLLVQLGDPGVGLRLIKAPLSDDCPIHFRKSAVGSDHLDRVFLVRFGKSHRFRVAELLR